MSALSARNVSGQPLYVPGVGDVANGDAFDVPGTDLPAKPTTEQVAAAYAALYSFTASANFKPVGKAGEAAHEAAAQAEAAAVEADRASANAGLHDNSGGVSDEPVVE